MKTDEFHNKLMLCIHHLHNQDRSSGSTYDDICVCYRYYFKHDPVCFNTIDRYLRKVRVRQNEGKIDPPILEVDYVDVESLDNKPRKLAYWKPLQVLNIVENPLIHWKLSEHEKAN